MNLAKIPKGCENFNENGLNFQGAQLVPDFGFP